MQRVVGVAEDGVPLVNLLYHVRVQAVLLENKGAIQKASNRMARTYMQLSSPTHDYFSKV